jgi:hypothetical protein
MLCYLSAVDLYNFQNFLLRVASHPVLSFDRLFIGFLQLGDGWRDSIKDTGKTLELFGLLEVIILILGLKVNPLPVQFNPLLLLFKSLLPGQEDCVFFSGHLNLHAKPETGISYRGKNYNN